MRYTVHLYREMRLLFEGIEADSHEAAASIARDKPTGDADKVEDCEGEDLAALVDVAGDEDYSQSVTIDFEAERQRKSAHRMLAALRAFIEADELADECQEWRWENLDHAFKLTRGAIAQAESAGILAISATTAAELLEALRLAQRALNTAPRFRVGDTDSYEIAATVDKAIGRATAA